MAITIDLAALGDGTYTIQDDGTPGNGVSVVLDPSGNVVTTFAHPGDELTILSRPGQSLDIKFTEGLGSANFTVGSLTSFEASPDHVNIGGISTSGIVTLVANGLIRELGSDAAPDITAAAVILSAGSGVGTGANAIEMRTEVLEAETTDGGISLANIGTLAIGGLTAEVAGLDVAVSGDLRLTNVGTIALADETGAASVHGGEVSGNVILVAKGPDADITSYVDQDAITAAGGSVTMTAGRDVSLGTVGANFDNDVRARDDLTITAGREVNVDGFTDLASDGFGAGSGGDVVVNAGRDINILNVTGTDGSIGAEGVAGGRVTLNAGPGGFVQLLATSAATLFSNSGNVVVNADHVVIAATAGITASTGTVTLRPVTEGWGVDLGSATDSPALGLSAAELDRIFTPTLNVGGTDAGPIRVVAAVAPANIQNLTLISGTDIWVDHSLTVAQMLRLFAGDNVLHVGGTISAATISAIVDNAEPDGGTGGFGWFGPVATETITVSGRADADILRGAEGVAQTVSGKAGNDTIYSSGEGTYSGDGGNDTIHAGDSSGFVQEVLDGGAGTDTLDTTHYDGNYVINMATGVTNWDESFLNFEVLVMGDGNDTVTGSTGNDRIDSGLGDDSVRGGLGDDLLEGMGGHDTLQGLGGNDTVRGAGGRDTIDGGAGEDLIDGGAGKDTLTGDSSRDVFQFRDGDFGATRALADVITDFSQAAGEKIQLALADANAGVGGDQAFTWIGNGAFTGAAGQLRYAQQGGNTYVEGDTDGDGAADVVIALTGVIDLVAADFVL